MDIVLRITLRWYVWLIEHDLCLCRFGLIETCGWLDDTLMWR